MPDSGSAPLGSFLTETPRMLCTIWVVYSLLALNAYDFGHYVNPNSWIKANLPKVTNPTRASGGIIFKLC